ncbi:MAG: DUF4396 domain-containing protein [Chlamydiales bacterium]|nr:DUF4396 domain-containing protein [Chlamydiales bacterium]
MLDDNSKIYFARQRVIDGILIFWFVLTGLSLIYMTYDLLVITPEAKVMKVGWWLVTLYTGPVGLFFYLISCKEPMPGTHEKFIEPLWKQSLGSMVHCLAGDVTGIVIAAIVITFFAISLPLELTIEYLAGFFFGLFIFQALFMKDMMGGSYFNALRRSFYPEFTSMNMIMTGMIPTMVIWNLLEPSAAVATSIHFWGKISLATIISGILAYPMNRWLVKTGLKHGMMTVRKAGEEPMEMEQAHLVHKHHETPKPTAKEKGLVLLLSLICLGTGILIAVLAWVLKTF